jgi:elongation factor G
MREYTTTDIRNVAFVGDAGADKTLLAEALAQNANSISTKGSIEKGAMVTDFDDLEKTPAFPYILSRCLRSWCMAG